MSESINREQTDKKIVVGDTHDCRIVAHQEVLEQWRENRPEDVERIREIDERIVEDPIYIPAETTNHLVAEFIDEVEEYRREKIVEAYYEHIVHSRSVTRRLVRKD